MVGLYQPSSFLKRELIIMERKALLWGEDIHNVIIFPYLLAQRLSCGYNDVDKKKEIKPSELCEFERDATSLPK